MAYFAVLCLLYFLSHRESLGQTSNDVTPFDGGNTSPSPSNSDGGAGIQLMGDNGGVQPPGIVPQSGDVPQVVPYQPQLQPFQVQPQTSRPNQPFDWTNGGYRLQPQPVQPLLQTGQPNQPLDWTIGNGGFPYGSSMASPPACYDGQQQKKGSFVLQCRNGNFEFAFCLLRGDKKIPMEGKYDDGNFVWACSQPSLGRAEMKAVACSHKGRQIQPGQTFPNGRMLMKCIVEGGGVIRTDVIGCVGDDGRESYSMGVVLFHSKPYRCIASNGKFDMQPSRASDTQVSVTLPSATRTQPPAGETQPSGGETPPSADETQPPASETQPLASGTQPPASKTQLFASATQLPAKKGQYTCLDSCQARKRGGLDLWELGMNTTTSAARCRAVPRGEV
uniref:Abnormal cell migration protein 18-like fibronectin type I domain-containing protein n=1 Tax=Romanomermis culicivorax TaxID=13658 RepID=A0A915KT09_ROMCU